MPLDLARAELEQLAPLDPSDGAVDVALARLHTFALWKAPGSESQRRAAAALGRVRNDPAEGRL